MKISIRMEGGIGDHLCAIRFLPAIKELYPDCEFYGFSDTENNTAPKNIIQTFWPSLFKDIDVIPTKKDKPYIIYSQFGKENYISAFDNIPDIYKRLMLNDYNKFYDLHIDGLKWMTYDFNWSKYFFNFLYPEIDLGPINKDKNRLVVSLYSDSNTSNLLDSQYVYNLLFQLSKKYKITVFATEKNKSFYSQCSQFADIVCDDIISVVRQIKNAGAFLCIDSGLKFLGYSVNTPTINFLSQIQSYGSLPIHQYIRWNPYAWSVIPLHYNIEHILPLVEQGIMYNTNLIPCFPNVSTDNVLVKRNVTL